MLFLYNLVIKFYCLVISIASWANPKAKLWVKGREGLLSQIAKKLDHNQKKIWFHFPSLGEFEQGRPVLERIRLKHPEKIIVVTFFSPSGYEVRENYPLADHIFYLPVDTSKNAREFIRLVNPELAIFTKYDYWYHYFNELNRQNVPLYVISAIFRKDQPFFKWYGGFQRKILSFITGIFVQDEESRILLEGIGITNVTISGDTRFDRVAENAGNPKHFPEIQDFCGDSNIFIAGSTWAADEKLIANLVTDYPDWKFIIAPHEISGSRIESLIELFPTALKYSSLNSQLPTPNSQLLLIDNIGILSSLYQYGDIAYIGGGFGTGIHNTLEAAVFNLPVIFGPNYRKFREARELAMEEAAFSIKDEKELKGIMDLLQKEQLRNKAGEKAGKYVSEHTGATEIILKKIYN